MCASNYKWYLDGRLPGERLPRRFAITAYPFVVGRSEAGNARISASCISSRHAQFQYLDDALWLSDLGSSNGTFVNGRRIEQRVRVESGDIVHFASVEFVINHEVEPAGDPFGSTSVFEASAHEADVRTASNAAAFRDLLINRRVVPFYQPIVALGNGDRLGFEILGRGAHPELSTTPWELFQLAEKVNQEVALSSLFREEGIKLAGELPGEPVLFVNAHPTELQNDLLIAAFESLRRAYPDVRVIVEPHESSVSDPARMRTLKSALAALGMGLAYDDFGTGQSRLRELVEVPPDYLKFDMGLIRGIDRAPVARQKMLEGLVRMVRDLGIACLAEGIERAEELSFCHGLGFEYAQGYFLGRPAPGAQWKTGAAETGE